MPQINALIEALDEPDPDLQATVEVLVDDFSAAVPSVLGLSLMLQLDGMPVTLTAIDPDLTLDTGASLVVPLDQMAGVGAGCRVVFYARNQGAFVDLAADIRDVGAGGRMESDHPPGMSAPPQQPGITGLADLRVVNRAIGVLITRGYSPADAHAELHRRGDDGPHGMADAASHVLASTNAPPHPQLSAAFPSADG